MKKTIAILFLLIFTFYCGGYFVVFKIQQYGIKKEIKTLIKQGVPTDNLTQIIVNSKNEHLLIWKHSKEFRYQGKMYDVVKKEVKGAHHIIYYCVSDRQETELFANLEMQVKKSFDQRNNGKNPFKNLFKLLSKICPHEVESNQIFQNETLLSSNFCFFYLPPTLRTNFPPPNYLI